MKNDSLFNLLGGCSMLDSKFPIEGIQDDYIMKSGFYNEIHHSNKARQGLWLPGG